MKKIVLLMSLMVLMLSFTFTGNSPKEKELEPGLIELTLIDGSVIIGEEHTVDIDRDGFGTITNLYTKESFEAMVIIEESITVINTETNMMLFKEWYMTCTCTCGMQWSTVAEIGCHLCPAENCNRESSLDLYQWCGWFSGYCVIVGEH